MKTEQEQRREIRQILFDANDICQATPCENEYCIYHGDYRCYDNVIVDKLIQAGYGDISEYKAEIERLKADFDSLKEDYEFVRECDNKHCLEIKETVKQAQIDVLKELKLYYAVTIDEWTEKKMERPYVYIEDIDELIKEVQNAEDKG